MLSDSFNQIACFIASSVGITYHACPTLDELPFYDSKAEAGVKLLKEVLKELLHYPGDREVNQLVDVVRPVASDMKFLKLSLSRKFDHYIPFKISFILTVFCGFDCIASAFHVCS